MGSKPVRSKFFIFFEPGKKSEIFFPRKNWDFSKNIGILSGNIGIYRKNRDFSKNIGILSGNIGIYQKNRRFFADFFTSNFFTRKSFLAPPKTDFSPKNRSKKPIF